MAIPRIAANRIAGTALLSRGPDQMRGALGPHPKRLRDRWRRDGRRWRRGPAAWRGRRRKLRHRRRRGVRRARVRDSAAAKPLPPRVLNQGPGSLCYRLERASHQGFPALLKVWKHSWAIIGAADTEILSHIARIEAVPEVKDPLAQIVRRRSTPQRPTLRRPARAARRRVAPAARRARSCAAAPATSGLHPALRVTTSLIRGSRSRPPPFCVTNRLSSPPRGIPLSRDTVEGIRGKGARRVYK
jgi:hypothetical protein